MKIALTISGDVCPSTISCSSATTAARLWCIGHVVERSKSWASSLRTSCRSLTSRWSGSVGGGSLGTPGTPKTPSMSASTSGSFVSTPIVSRSSYQNIETPSKVGSGCPS